MKILRSRLYGMEREKLQKERNLLRQKQVIDSIYFNLFKKKR